MVKADVQHISPFLGDSKRTFWKEGVLTELQPKKTTQTPRGEHVRFSVGAQAINRIPVALRRKEPNSLLTFTLFIIRLIHPQDLVSCPQVSCMCVSGCV